MPVPGSTVGYTICRRTVNNTPASGLTSADFTMTATLDGISISPSYSVSSIKQDGIYWAYNFAITYTGSEGKFFAHITAATGTDVIVGGLIDEQIQAYDFDALAALLLIGNGSPATNTPGATDLGSIVDRDSYKSPTQTLTSTRLAALGITNLSASGVTVEAACMSAPGGTSYPISVAIVSGSGLQVTLGWTTQPFPSLTGAANPYSQGWRIDVQVVVSGSTNTLVTPNTYGFTQIWQAETRTS